MAQSIEDLQRQRDTWQREYERTNVPAARARVALLDKRIAAQD